MKRVITPRAEASTLPRRKRARTERGKSLIERDGERLEVDHERVTSDELAEISTIVDTLAAGYKRTIEYYRHWGSSPEVAVEHAEGGEWLRERALTVAPQDITWDMLRALGDGELREALEVWERIRCAAIDELESGILTARTIGAETPIEKAIFLAVRDKFLDGWQPQNGIESALIEMLAESFSLFQYWTAIAHKRATRTHDAQRKALGRFEDSSWKSPYQSEAEAVEQAHKLADSYNRQFLRTLRQLRDLRRYTPPVIVNNGGQVNVANQQVNVTKQR